MEVDPCACCVDRTEMELKMGEKMSNQASFIGFCFELKNSETSQDKDDRVGKGNAWVQRNS